MIQFRRAEAAFFACGKPIGKHAAGRTGCRHEFDQFVKACFTFIKINQLFPLCRCNRNNSVFNFTGAVQRQIIGALPVSSQLFFHAGGTDA